MELRYHWGTHLNEDEDVKLRSLVAFLKLHKIIPVDTKYAVVKYLLLMAHKVLFDERLVELRDILYEKKKIKKPSLIDAFQYAMLIACLTIKQEYGAASNQTKQSLVQEKDIIKPIDPAALNPSLKPKLNMAPDTDVS